MKKKIGRAAALILLLAMVTTLAGCGANMKMIDTTWKFDRGVIAMPDGSTVQGEVSSWKDYVSSDAMLVTIDGKTYYTHMSNVVLIAD